MCVIRFMSALLLGNTACCAMIAVAEANEFSGAEDGRAILCFAICLQATWRTLRQMLCNVLRYGKAAASACIAPLCPSIAKALSRLLDLFRFHKQAMPFYCWTRRHRVDGG